mmetsp:Transcript_3438/g.8133  ORF Transcript_3438/g.8133 Transcript_3438/m.8133 type:complete len:102 (+) Transcript_3438:48-353(+)
MSPGSTTSLGSRLSTSPGALDAAVLARGPLVCTQLSQWYIRVRCQDPFEGGAYALQIFLNGRLMRPFDDAMRFKIPSQGGMEPSSNREFGLDHSSRNHFVS